MVGFGMVVDGITLESAMLASPSDSAGAGAGASAGAIAVEGSASTSMVSRSIAAGVNVQHGTRLDEGKACAEGKKWLRNGAKCNVVVCEVNAAKWHVLLLEES